MLIRALPVVAKGCVVLAGSAADGAVALRTHRFGGGSNGGVDDAGLDAPNQATPCASLVPMPSMRGYRPFALLPSTLL